MTFVPFGVCPLDLLVPVCQPRSCHSFAVNFACWLLPRCNVNLGVLHLLPYLKALPPTALHSVFLSIIQEKKKKEKKGFPGLALKE